MGYPLKVGNHCFRVWRQLNGTSYSGYTKALQVHQFTDLSSQHGSQTSSSSSAGSVFKMQKLRPIVSDLLNQNMNINKIPRESESIFKFENNCSFSLNLRLVSFEEFRCRESGRLRHFLWWI